jgi:hypothetical protein
MSYQFPWQYLDKLTSHPLYEQAVDFYPILRDEIVKSGDLFGFYDVDRLAACFAVLSPMSSLRRNVELYFQAVNAVVPRTFVANATKAWRLLWDGATVGDSVKGPKVKAFYQSIIGDTSIEAVCVDRHVARWDGNRPNALTPKRIRECQIEIGALAEQLGILPSAAQSVIWHCDSDVRPDSVRPIPDLFAEVSEEWEKAVKR